MEMTDGGLRRSIEGSGDQWKVDKTDGGYRRPVEGKSGEQDFYKRRI